MRGSGRVCLWGDGSSAMSCRSMHPGATGHERSHLYRASPQPTPVFRRCGARLPPSLRCSDPSSPAAVLALAGCGGGPDASALRLDVERRDPSPLLTLYLGALLGPNGGDPVAAGLAARDGDAWTLDGPAIAARAPDGAPAIDADGDGDVDADELTAFAQATYAAARAFPATLDALALDTAAAFPLDVSGVMTTARRRVFMPRAALQSALAGYRAAGDRLVYPVGTTVWGAHAAPDGETTLMRKRADGVWDFAVYDRAGRLADATSGAPRPLRAPTQCIGCHAGSKLFEPEKSFPRDAPAGPDGPRAVHTPHRSAAAAAFFDEHARRSDGLLGLYATVYAAANPQDSAVAALAIPGLR